MKRTRPFLVMTLIMACGVTSCATAPPSSPSPLMAQATRGEDLDKGIEILAQQLITTLPPDKKPLLAVLDFSLLDGTVSAFGRLVGEDLVTKLFLTRKVRVVERSLLEKAVAELKLNLSGLVDPDRAKRLGKQVGADVIVTGTITDLKTTVKINARMIEVETGDILAAAGVEVFQDQRIMGLMAQIIGHPTRLSEEKETAIPSSEPFFENELISVTVKSLKRVSKNTMRLVVNYKNVSNDKIGVGVKRESFEGYIVDESGEKWELEERDSGIPWSWCCPRLDFPPGVDTPAKFTFLAKSDPSGKVFTLFLALWTTRPGHDEFNPKFESTRVIIKDIKMEDR